jgi:UDP-GlcNAc:undecaprenyl-phosphate GlcNAc-1-phosphate transferase
MENISAPYLFPLVLSAITTLVGIRFALDFFPKWKLLDKPKKYGLHRKPIPYGVGVILFINFVLISLLFLPLSTKLIGLFIGATLLVATGLIDDFLGLTPKSRIIIQIISALVIILAGYEVFVITNPFGGTIPLDITYISIGTLAISLFSALFLIVWIVGMVNTVNFLDGVPGLASGIATIAGIVLFLLAIRPDFHVVNQESFALLVGILTASTAVFWIFDLPPPKLLMGDTGSTFLGFMLAIFAVFAGGKIATAFIVMGFPIFDVLMTIIRRLLQKKSPFKGDKQHLHHDLLRVGLSEKQTNFIIYTLSALFGLTALYLGSFQKLIAITSIFIIMAILKISLIKAVK